MSVDSYIIAIASLVDKIFENQIMTIALVLDDVATIGIKRCFRLRSQTHADAFGVSIITERPLNTVAS